jgi:hypothetical protein
VETRLSGKGAGPICAKHPPGCPGKLDLSFSTALKIGSNIYAFAPSVSVDSVTNTVYVTYTLRGGTAAGDALRHDLALLDASDGTGVSTSASKASVDAFWVYADSTNYTFADDCLTRLFAAPK